MAKPANTTPPLPYPVSSKSLDNLARFDQDLTKALHYYLIDLARRANLGLARDGSEPMEGSLDMGGFNISNIANITITGTVTLTAPLPIAQGGTASTTSSAARTALDVPGLTTANVFTKTQTWAKGADIAPSTGVLTLGADGNYFDVTGTGGFSSIAAVGSGNTVIKLHFDAAMTITHHSTNLILPDGANITTAAGDELEFIEYASGQWRCTNYQPATTASPTGWVYIDTQILSAASTATFSNLSAYRLLRAEYYFTQSNDGEIIFIQTSVGGTFATSGADYNNQTINGFSSTVNAVNLSTSGFRLGAPGNAANEALSGVTYIFEFNQSKQAHHITDSFYLDTTATPIRVIVGGRRLDTSARDGIRFVPNAGTLTGYVILYGVVG